MAQLKETKVPDLGGASEVTVIEILVKVGDEVGIDTPIVTLESDKATLEVPAGAAGKVKKIAVKVGDHVNQGAVLLSLEAEAAAPEIEDTKNTSTQEKPTTNMHELKDPAADEKSVAMKVSTQKANAEQKTLDEESNASEQDVHAGPGVRRMARELGVNLTEISGSGPKQRVLKEDIDSFVKSTLSKLKQAGAGSNLLHLPNIDFSKFGSIEVKALSRIKKISGKNLQRNWTMIPHVTQFGEADITELEAFRQSQKIEMEKNQIKLTPLVFIMKAIASTLRVFPHFNASLDAQAENLILKHYIHVGVAVDTPDGLVVPVIRDVDKKGLVDLAKELAVLSQKARDKQLTPGDMQGGSMSISSLGGIGGTAFTPIINHPEVAILGVSKSSYKPVYDKGTFVPRLMLPLSLSYDHRVIDGADGARFMVYLTNVLSDIRNCLL